MKRENLKELHYITPTANVVSILQHGILSHRRAKQVEHTSLAMPEIQDRRAKVVVPAGRPLHEYANLYICGRNPMLIKRKGRHRDTCVLRVSPDVLDLPGVVVTDGNASSEYVAFRAAPGGLRIVDEELTFAEWWTDPDQITKWRKKSAKCAEVLVPDSVAPGFIMGAYVSCDDALERFGGLGVAIEPIVDGHLFFL